MQVAKEVKAKLVRLPPFGAFSGAFRAGPTMRTHILGHGPCKFTPTGKAKERVTRIGEVHVIPVHGMSDKFEYTNRADSTISIGLSASPTSGFQFSGTGKVTNSIGTDAGFTAGPGTVSFVDSHFYYQRYIDNEVPACPENGPYKIQAVKAVGDAFKEMSSHHPRNNPFSATTGFSTDIRDEYTNKTAHSQQLCGTKEMPDAPIIYNNGS